MFLRKICILFSLISFLLSQFPIELERNEVTNPFYFTSEIDTEYLLTINASTNCNWAIADTESAVLKISINDNWTNYNQDIVLFSGNTNHTYYAHLGFINNGQNNIRFKFDYNKSSIGAQFVHIENIYLSPINEIDIDEDVVLHSPIIYGRDILQWNESNRTDIPIILFHEIEMINQNKVITYSIIFSNEDSRLGIGLSELMLSYGRTTDIEWVYEVVLDPQSNIINEVFQGPSHTTTNFTGEKINKHPILKNATLNCNFTDVGDSEYKFFLSPIFSLSNEHTREYLMDQNPWSYRIMSEELINEQKYEIPSNPESFEISDSRNYLYIEFSGVSSGTIESLDIFTNFYNSCEIFVNHNNHTEINYNFYGGKSRTSIELPVNFNSNLLKNLSFRIINYDSNSSININNISKLFYLNENYEIINLDIDFSPFTLNNTNPIQNILINNLNIDCLGIEEGDAECDECNVCNGDNQAMDSCGICFGDDENLDCNNICFGTAYEDQCGVCDQNTYNDNLTCSGCTDTNALNFDPNALFNDDTCEYSDQIFHVPQEYSTIQSAIMFSSDFDTILVSAGIYYENINFLEKSIIIISDSYLENNYPTIQGEDSLSVVTINNSINAGLIGFNIKNGYGRGIPFEDFISLASDQNILDSLLINVIRGGGISIINSNCILNSLNIFNNSSRNVGGGIGIINSQTTIINSSIYSNHVIDDDALGGGGIAINGGNTQILSSNIYENIVGNNLYSLSGGGGILCGFSFNDPLQLSMDQIEIYNNSGFIGGGIGALSGNISLNKTNIFGNSGEYGSVFSLGEPLGLVIGDINMSINQSILTQNEGLIGVGLINSAYLNAINTIFWNNGNIDFAPLPNNQILNINFSFTNSETLFDGEGNISQNPLFENILNNNFNLSLISPCIDAGYADINNDGIDDIVDFFGQNPDMGSYEKILLGDINQDWNHDINDLIKASEIIFQGTLDLSLIEFETTNINDDEMIDILDLILLIKIILDIE